ncbi:hypothetical protein HDV00_001638 [Rhizophlyctis rosea]|nr:hypothetical protein HDV00_001638 [Rhizophlyctis rosea]
MTVLEVKQPIEKLPLAARKNFRDEFENQRADLEKQISDLLGEQWKIDINPNLIYVYAEKDSWGQTSPGDCIKGYVEGAIYQLKYLTESHGPILAQELNTLVSTHTLTLYPDLEKKNTYCGVDVHDGVLRLLFAEGNLGTNTSYALEKLEAALNDASKATNPTSLSYRVRLGIERDWTQKFDALKASLVAQTHNDSLELVPNFEANAEALKNGGKDVRDDWETNLGDFTRQYFEGLEWIMRGKGFKDDDMLWEGFGEAVEKGKVEFRVVDKIEKSYGEAVIEDGVLVLKVKPDTFGTNISYIAENIVDLL